jgi:trk system potassium uptake protein TrkH
MRREIVIRFIGNILIFNSVFLFISFVISLVLREPSTIPLLYSTLICLILGLFPLMFVPRGEQLTIYESVTIVSLGWFITCMVGALPYILWGGEFSLADTFFESVSGYTTTGASILVDVEALPKGLLFWRSSTHFIGGVGIVLFVLFILPQASSSRSLLNTELSELSRQHFKYRAKDVLKILVGVYMGLTIAEIILLKVAGMSLFDAICHSFATIATGGFSTKNLNIAYYHSVYIEVIIMVFMLVSAIHFGLLFNTFTFKKTNIFTSPVARSFVLIMFAGILLITLKLHQKGTYSSWWESLRYASFQAISLGSTTGFASANSEIWPGFAKLVIIYLTIQCGMVGSTAGGLKFDRVYIFFKSIGKQIKLMQHPSAIALVKSDKFTISEQLELNTIVFIVLYLSIILINTLLLSFMNVDLLTAFSGVVSTIGNCGPGFGKVYSLGNYNGIPDLGKFLLSINMLLGRLEIFNIISLFYIRKWK